MKRDDWKMTRATEKPRAPLAALIQRYSAA
jgi:hypothetical protein